VGAPWPALSMVASEDPGARRAGPAPGTDPTAMPSTTLEAFVLADTAGSHDTELLRLFHKRNLRAHMLLGPAGSAMTHHHTIQQF